MVAFIQCSWIQTNLGSSNQTAISDTVVMMWGFQVAFDRMKSVHQMNLIKYLAFYPSKHVSSGPELALL